MRYCKTLILAALVALSILPALPGADWPSYRGPGGLGISPEKGLLKTWPEGGPKLLWTSTKAGLGYAGMAVVGGTVYTMGARGADEYVIALDGKGEEIWATKMGPVHEFKGNEWSHGPNATPTVDGELIYGLSSRGMLVCVNKAGGKLVWGVDVAKDLEGVVKNEGGGPEKFGWGYSWSPVVDGDQLIIAPGGPKGLIAGLDKKTGKLLWRSKDAKDPATYSSPVLATIGGVKQVLYLGQQTLYSVSAKDGALLWKHTRDDPFPDVVCPSPVVKGNLVLISVGYNAGSELLEISNKDGKFSAESKWTKKVIGNKQGGVTLVGDHVYGYHENSTWACIELETGNIAWPKRRMKQGLKAGGFVVADGRLYVADEGNVGGVPGTIGMIEATPKAYNEISTFTLPQHSKQRKTSGKLWTYPALSDGKLYVRDQELVFCFEVK